MNKKGEFLLTEVFAFIVVVGFLFGFFLLFEFADDTDTQSIESLEMESEGKFALSLLKTPVKDYFLVTDLIAKSSEENNYTQLDYFLKDLFEETNNYWYVAITPIGGEKVVFSRQEWVAISGKKSFSEKNIPDFNGNLINLRILISPGIKQSAFDLATPPTYARGVY